MLHITLPYKPIRPKRHLYDTSQQQQNIQSFQAYLEHLARWTIHWPKTILSKFKRTEITQRMFSNYNEMKWDFNNRRVCGKFTNR